MKKTIRLIASLCAIFCLMTVPFSVSAAKPSIISAEEWEVLKITNKERAAEGLGALSVFSDLQKVGDVRAKEITEVFSHDRPDGSSCFTALNNIPWSACGENIAAGQTGPAEVMSAWMTSPGHRSNIMDGNYKHIGIGYTFKQASEYGYYWVQMFVGGCQTTAITKTDVLPVFDTKGRLLSEDVTLAVTCNLHGTSYLPLESVSYKCNAKSYGKTTMTVQYDGITATLPCTVGFEDVSAKDWYFDEVMYAVNNGLFKGISETKFAPDQAMTRAMLVTVLYRMEGQPGVQSGSAFKDVPQKSWYTKAVTWAAENDIVNGVGGGKFAPDDNVTREQMAAILYRYSRFKEKDVSARGDISVFRDKAQISSYAKTPLRWAVGEKLIQGKEKNQLDPRGSATRAEVATILQRYLEK